LGSHLVSLLLKAGLTSWWSQVARMPCRVKIWKSSGTETAASLCSCSSAWLLSPWGILSYTKSIFACCNFYLLPLMLLLWTS